MAVGQSIDLGRFIREQRTKKGISGRELSDMVSYSQSYIYNIERGVQYPSMITCSKILDTLSIQYKVLDDLTIKLNDGRLIRFSVLSRNPSQRGINIGKFIKEQRIAKGISVVELANKALCHPSFIRGIERSAQYPSQNMGCMILSSLSVQYEILDDFTVKLTDGRIIRFKASVQGQNRRKGVKLTPDQFRSLEMRVAALEERIQILEKGV